MKILRYLPLLVITILLLIFLVDYLYSGNLLSGVNKIKHLSGSPICSIGWRTKTCPNLSCLETDLEKELFRIWKDEFKTIHQLNDNEFNDMIVILDAGTNVPVDKKLRPGLDWLPDESLFMVHYFIKKDWALLPNDSSMLAAEYPSMTMLPEEVIRNSLRDMERNITFWHKNIISEAQMKEIISTKLNKVTLDYTGERMHQYGTTCNTYLASDRSGAYTTPMIDGHYGENNRGFDDMCYSRKVNLLTGKYKDHESPCMVEF